MSDQNVKAAQKYLNAMFGGHKDCLLYTSVNSSFLMDGSDVY